MRKRNSFYDTVDQVVSHGVQQGMLHLYQEDDSLAGNQIVLQGKRLFNFGSCSYLGLEFDSRLKEAAKDAIGRYGTQFSESRAYVSLGLYKELERLLEQIFDAHPVVTPTTTLGHIAAIPVLVNDEDAVIIDHQAHNSIQTAVTLLKPRGIPVELLRHSRMDILEEKIKALRYRHSKIWYMADGIYSMFGDGCPVKEVYALMDKYPELHFYVDDAHGMSIYGKHGRGYVLDGRQLHPKMVMATSLNKSFASGGGVILFPDAETARKVRTCGGPLITSGPMQPASLGAAVAAAKIHLSEEIYEMQSELKDKRKYARLLLEKTSLPVVSGSDASVFFVGAGLPKVGYNLIKRMMNTGFYLNLGIFPAVPMKQTGVRFTITRLHKFAQIDAMINTLAEQLPSALKEENSSITEVYKAFKLPTPEAVQIEKVVASVIKQSLSLKLTHYNHIAEIEQAVWDKFFSGKGSFDWQGLQTLEDTFSNNKLPEDNWKFDYVIIRDVSGEIVLATFLTTALWKDDMLSPASVSKLVEDKRQTDPYFLTSKVTAIGSLLTEGEHVYIDKDSPLWKEALQLLTEKISLLQESYHSNSSIIRDFHFPNDEMDKLMIDQGYFKITMPDTNIVEKLEWQDKEDFYLQLSKRSQQHFREDVRKHENKFDISIIQGTASSDEIDYWYQLYRNVQQHSFELNTFQLPKKVFSTLLKNKNWEVLTLSLKQPYNPEESDKPVCVVYSYQSGDAYIPMIIGLDYTFNKKYKIYRQALYRLVMRTRELNKKKVLLGFSANIEKHKVGALAMPTCGYMQYKDSFNVEVLEALNRKDHGTERRRV